ncbi:MAG: hypothetical protein A3G30_06335 [Chlamydiae bacterium RIFCSPLOWO2_12_FULL_49_12]|nr:MAG: hypothetical protein A3D18_05445 [Chlamydiae bacterium RIFCSPHIGHO2_02_FULL_49_29]OGN64407.1 MAG: hypothetical protein A3E26_05565 [Chlamydiae bacterium RIFCSPHIGHO2_12_FULL_49_32]OGN70945.1 MAG: hypothetical protein A3G30_06335 [Chlamydiae bacterium RIFCSPLOWO2_12_FULL_49_12]
MTILADGKKELQGFILKQLQKSVLYRTHFKNWNFGCAKASGFDDRILPHISNIGPDAIVEPGGAFASAQIQFFKCVRYSRSLQINVVQVATAEFRKVYTS